MIKKLRVSSKDTLFYDFLDKSLLTILIGFVLIFVFYPILCVINQSITLDGSLSFDLYKNIIGKNKHLLFNSISVGIISATVATLIATIVAIYISFLSNKLKNIGKVILMLSMISPPFIASLAYIQLFGKRGYITHYLLNIDYNPYGAHGVVAMQVLSFIPISALMIMSVIEKVDNRVLKASLDLGASKNFTVLNILIPLIKPGIVVSFLLSFVRSLADFGTVTIIGGKFETIATEIYMEIIGYANFNLAAAMNVILMLPAIFIFIPYRKNMKRLNSMFKENEKTVEDDVKITLSGILKILFLLVTLGFIIFNTLQYGCIFLSSISKFSKGEFIFTLDYIKNIKEYSLHSFIRSIIYSLISGLVGSFIGVMISYYIEKRKIIGGVAIDFITTLPYILPGTFFGIAYILAFNKQPFLLTGTSFIVIVNCIFKQIPLTTKTSSAILSQISEDLENSARDLGASRIHVIKDVILPNAKEAFQVGFINNFTSTMTTFGALIFLVYPGKEVATVKLFHAINSGEYGIASMMSVVIILITLIVNVLFTLLVSRKKVV